MAALLDISRKKRIMGLLDPVSNVVQQKTWNQEEIPLWSPEGDVWGERSIAGLNQAIANIAAYSNESMAGTTANMNPRHLMIQFSKTLEGTGFDKNPQAFLNLFKRYMTPEQHKYFTDTTAKAMPFLTNRAEKGWKPYDEEAFATRARTRGFWDIFKPWVMQ